MFPRELQSAAQDKTEVAKDLSKMQQLREVQSSARQRTLPESRQRPSASGSLQRGVAKLSKPYEQKGDRTPACRAESDTQLRMRKILLTVSPDEWFELATAAP